MSTNADSAKKWVEENQPDKATLCNFIKKLEVRLESMAPEHPEWDGNEDALHYLQEQVDLLQSKQHVSSQTQSDVTFDVTSIHGSTYTPSWDTSSLTPEVQIQDELSTEQKRVMFEQLKKKMSN